MSRQNCWEFMNCGRQTGGDKVAELGECKAVSCFKAHGLNHGINGGRSCWAVAGTFCGGQVQGAFIEKYRGCASCDFFHAVAREEGGDLIPVQELLSFIKNRPGCPPADQEACR